VRSKLKKEDMEDSKTRFSDRVSDYKKYRPTYPVEIISFVLENCPVDKKWKIADIGSGTGISSKLLSLGLKAKVYAVEPNLKMRETAEVEEKGNELFVSINGSAEATTLKNESVNLVCAFQAFHWFDKEKSRKEFIRILKAPKWILFVWNDRVTNETGFLEEYEMLLTGLPEYKIVHHKNISEANIAAFCGTTEIIKKEFGKNQKLDWEGLKGRFSSSSYTPKNGTAEYKNAVSKLKRIFDDYNNNGIVELKYTTEVFLGKMK
jgi:SAM-dependent methyltransferase